MALHKSGSGNKHQNRISGLVPFLFGIATLYCVRLANLVLDLLCWLVPQSPLSFLFQPIDRVYIEFVLRSLYFPIRPRDQLDSQSLLLFAPIISSFNQVLDSGNKSSPTPTLFLVWTKYKIRLHEVALPLTIEKNRWCWTIQLSLAMMGAER